MVSWVSRSGGLATHRRIREAIHNGMYQLLLEPMRSIGTDQHLRRLHRQPESRRVKAAQVSVDTGGGSPTSSDSRQRECRTRQRRTVAGKPVGLQPDQTPMAGIVGTEMAGRARVERSERALVHPGT